MKLGIALSGGGIRGIAHSGVLKALEEEGIDVDIFTGTSSGSHVAFLGAIGYSSKKIKETYDANINSIVGNKNIFNFSNMFLNNKFKMEGLRSGKGIETLYCEIGKEYGIKKISDVKKELGVVATDIKKEKEVWFTSKKLDDKLKLDRINITDIDIGKAIRASSSFSVIFDPCRDNENIYLDGGIFNNTPVDLAYALGADKVVAVKFDSSSEDFVSDNIFGIGMKTIDIMSKIISNRVLENADVVVNIKSETSGFLNVKKTDFYCEEGYKSMKEKIEEVKKLF